MLTEKERQILRSLELDLDGPAAPDERALDAGSGHRDQPPTTPLPLAALFWAGVLVVIAGAVQAGLLLVAAAGGAWLAWRYWPRADRIASGTPDPIRGGRSPDPALSGRGLRKRD